MLPQEIALSGLADNALVEVSLDIDPGNGQPVRQRLASTRAALGKQSLLRVTLSTMNCELECGSGLTCNWGRCLDPFIPAEALEEYTPDWFKYSWCKPKTAGAPTVLLGTGYSSFVPADPQTPVELWAGEQGGHHIFVSLRTRNLRQSSVVKLSGELVDTGETVGPLAAVRVFPDDPAAGYCEMNGFLFQLDTKMSIFYFLGKTMKLTAQVSDNDGASVTETQTILLPEEPLSP
jgi:hypothetical protein